MLFQPCDWHEHDAFIDGEKQYVVDAYGRTEEGRAGCIRITGFKPFLYVRAEGARIQGCKTTVFQKYDILAGWNQLETVTVWKLEVNTMEAFRKLKGQVEKRVVYEADLPPFLRIFHEHNLGPGSPFKCTATPIDFEEDRYCVEAMFRASHTTLAPVDVVIPLVVACYDLEMYSGHGKFPVAKKSWEAVFKTICEDIDEAPESLSLADILCIRLEKEGGSPNRDHVIRFLKTSGVQDALDSHDIDYLVRNWKQPCIGDPIIQIGISFRNSTDLLAPTLRKVFVLGTVEDDPEFVSFHTERDMILAFSDFLKEQNPDIICGYNTFGFDDGYLVDRCDILDITSSVMFGRTPAYQDKHLVSKTFELASGKYDLRYWNSTGRLCIDLLLNMRREHSLDSFKLDNVASVFLRGSVQKVEGKKVYTKSTRGLRARNFVKFETVGNTTDPYTDKVVVEEVGPNYFILQDDVLRDAPGSLEWTLAKDDVDAHTLFALHKQGPAERARIARYCIQDCDLVLTLMAKLDTLVNARGMAEVCKVPMSFVLLRGQGIKIFSAVVSIASTRNQILRTQPNGNGPVEDWSYEGAIVIEPKIDMYLDQPISVLDFNSLYPTNMIAYNISPDTLVSERTFNPDGKLIASWGKTSDEMRALRKAGHVLDDISYDNKKDDIVTGKTICTYAQPGEASMSRGILPLVLDILLKKRKETRKLAETIADEGQKAVLNGLQLAYKVVANSVYGQTGSRTSPIRRLCVAASTTAAGRTQLLFAKKVVEEEFNGEVIYGDTDSIFIKFLTKDVGDSIVLGTKAAERITELCRKPYVIGYEKTFYPFILFCRKRYVGMMYEEDPNPAKAKRKSMGIVLKRRDNAPIVKEVFGGALDILLQDRDIKKAQGFVVDTLKKVLEHKIPIEKYVVSKSLRDDYKNPGQIAHRVLADRMAERDPGNKPQVGDRIPYIYVDGRGGKQGDRIDHIDYVRQNNLRPDVEFYITNQIQNPVAQLFALCIESMDGYREPRPSYKQVYETLLEKRKGNTEEATIDLLAKKEKQLDSLMFLSSEYLKNILRKHKRGPMDAFLKR
jgi:DNA polymerase elongation subunit (family B)